MCYFVRCYLSVHDTGHTRAELDFETTNWPTGEQLPRSSGILRARPKDLTRCDIDVDYVARAAASRLILVCRGKPCDWIRYISIILCTQSTLVLWLLPSETRDRSAVIGRDQAGRFDIGLSIFAARGSTRWTYNCIPLFLLWNISTLYTVCMS